MIKVSDHIIKGCIKGNRTAQKELFTLTHNFMYGVIVRYVKDLVYAHDVMQEAYIKVYTKLHTYTRSKAALTTWMHPIAVRSAINHLRKRHNYFLDIDQGGLVHDSVENTGLERLDAEHILQLIQQLPDIQRVIFNMHVIEGYSHTEISEELDIPVPTSRSYLSRAKATLRNKIESMPFKMRRS